MATYNAVVGASQDTINEVLSSLFGILQPDHLFEFGFDIGAAGFRRVEINMTASPTVYLKPSIPGDIHGDVVKSAIQALGQDTSNNFVLAEVLSDVGKTTFKIRFPTVQVRLFFEHNSGSDKTYEDVTASLDVVAGLQLDTSTSPALVVFKGLKATAEMGDKGMMSLVNNAIIPHFLPLLNEKILVPIGIPMLKILGVEMTVPVPVVENGFLAAYSALGRVPPVVPVNKPLWPAHGIFACVDSDLITQVATPAIASAIKVNDRSFGSISDFQGSYSLGFGRLSNVIIHEDGRLSASGNIAARIRITYHHGLPFFKDPSFDLGASGSLGITASVRVQHGIILGTIASMDHFAFDLDLGVKPWSVLPNFIEKAIDARISNLRNELVHSHIKPRVESELANKTFPLTTMPPIDIPLGPGFKMMLSDIEMGSETSTGNTYLMAYGMPQISKK